MHNHRPNFTQMSKADILRDRPDRVGFRYDYGHMRVRKLELMPGLVKQFKILERI
jgi:hypothetical protein